MGIRRAGRRAMKYCFGDDVATLSEYAWYRREDDKAPNPKVKGIANTHVVGLKRPNDWGLHDMHGNVWEWCQSRWAGYPYAADDGRETPLPRMANTNKDPRVLTDAHVVRGGSWHHGARAATSFNRAASRPADHRYYYGFRVATFGARIIARQCSFQAAAAISTRSSCVRRKKLSMSHISHCRGTSTNAGITPGSPASVAAPSWWVVDGVAHGHPASTRRG